MALHEYEATAEVKAGKLRVRNRRAYDLALAAFTDGEVSLRIERRRATRSQQQNRWYWGVIVQAVSDYTGYSPEEVHEFLKAKFIPKRIAVADGNGEVIDDYVIGGSSAKLDKNGFGEYCENVRRWAAETLAIDIPDPNQ